MFLCLYLLPHRWYSLCNWKNKKNKSYISENYPELPSKWLCNWSTHGFSGMKCKWLTHVKSVVVLKSHQCLLKCWNTWCLWLMKDKEFYLFFQSLLFFTQLLWVQTNFGTRPWSLWSLHDFYSFLFFLFFYDFVDHGIQPLGTLSLCQDWQPPLTKEAKRSQVKFKKSTS